MRVALPGGLLVVIRVIAAVFTYVAVFDATALVMYAIGVAIVPDEARGTFGLIGLGIAEAAALATVLVFWRLMDPEHPAYNQALVPHGSQAPAWPRSES